MRPAIPLLCLALAGCASNTPAGWQKAGASPADVSRAFQECNYEARKATPPTTVPGDIAGEGLRIRSLRNECLELKGYRQ